MPFYEGRHDAPGLCGRLHHSWFGYVQNRRICGIHVKRSRKLHSYRWRKYWQVFGLQIKQLGPKDFEISQLFLIDCIITFLGLQSDTSETHCNDKFTSAAAQILSKDLQGKPRKKTWKYKTAAGMMSYLQAHSQPDISMPVHQTACFSNDSKLFHKQAITCISHYLIGMKTRGIRYKIDCSKD